MDRNTNSDDYKIELLRFIRRVGSFEPGKCWLWPTPAPNGYGYIYTRGTGVMLAHRYAYELLISPIPAGLFVCHTCDVRRCVNPEHHFLGTRDDNMLDAVSKGRIASWKKLSPQESAEVRASNASARALAVQHGVSTGTIYNIRHRVFQ